MRFLFIIPSYKPAYIYGGPIRTVAALCETLAKTGNDVTVYTTTANGSEELDVVSGNTYDIEGVMVIYFSRLTKRHSNYSRQLLSALKTNIANFDIVHIQSWWNLVCVPATRICLKNGVQPIISPRGTLTHYTFTHNRSVVKRFLHFFLGKQLLEKSVLLFSSAREQEEASKYIAPMNSYVIPNLLNLPDKLHGINNDEDFLKIVFLGRIDPAKNIELLLAALTADHGVPFQLSIIGSGDEDYTNSLRNSYTGSGHIEWVGSLDGEDKYRRLAEADVLALPSHTENFGNVVLESLSQGTPVIISEHVGAKEYVLKNNLGWVVEDGVKNWKEAIQHIWIRQDQRKDMRHRARLCIARDYLEKDQVKAYIELYHKYKRPLSRK